MLQDLAFPATPQCNQCQTQRPGQKPASKSMTGVYQFFRPFALLFAAGADALEATLAARDDWDDVALLPFLTTSSCLFCANGC